MYLNCLVYLNIPCFQSLVEEFDELQRTLDEELLGLELIVEKKVRKTLSCSTLFHQALQIGGLEHNKEHWGIIVYLYDDRMLTENSVIC